MKRLTIHETRNGCIIVDGDTESLSILGTIHNSWSYATPQEAADRVRLEVQEWELQRKERHEEKQAAKREALKKSKGG